MTVKYVKQENLINMFSWVVKETCVLSYYMNLPYYSKKEN